MELVEGVGESSSPPRSSGGPTSSYDVKSDVYNRLIERGNEDAIHNPDFRDRLNAHFNRLPSSYVVDVNMDGVEDVVEHMKLLAMAKELDNRPAFHVQFLENIWTRADGIEEGFAVYTQRPSLGVENGDHVPSHNRQVASSAQIHKVIFCTADKPKLLSQLSGLLSDIGLNLREAHVFSTADGYSLDVFVVDGWPVEDTQGLHVALEGAIDRCEGTWSGSSILETESKAPANWEIDKRLLKIGDRIASGSCGDLYHGIYLGQDVAIKILRSEHLNEALEGEFAQEVAILREVRHKNVVRFIGACTKSPSLCIVTEFMHGGSLYNYLQKTNKVLKLSQVVKFAIDVCKGMEYLHENNIIHRDLKTANLLMDTQQVVKVADFGVARFLNQGGVMTAETGTYRWMAPEVINHLPYDQKADIFSFAIVLWELVMAKVPYDTMTPLQAALGVRQGLRPELPENTHPKLLNTMQRCWDSVPSNRPPFSAIRIELERLLLEIEGTFSGTRSN